MNLVLSIGSNLSSDNVAEAILWLRGRLSKMEVSRIYETPAVKGGMRSYSNAVVSGETYIELEDFNALLKKYEENCGRTPETRLRGDVVIDIDIVVCDGEILRPWDFRQNFFRIGYASLPEVSSNTSGLELASSPVQ